MLQEVLMHVSGGVLAAHLHDDLNDLGLGEE